MSYEDNLDGYQAAREEPLAGDEELAGITVYQAQKCGAILDAYAGGLELYRDAARMAIHLLMISGSHAIVRPSAEEAWATVDAAPWPLPRNKWPRPGWHVE